MRGYDKWEYPDDDAWNTEREPEPQPSRVAGTEIIMPRELEAKRRRPLWKRVANLLTQPKEPRRE